MFTIKKKGGGAKAWKTRLEGITTKHEQMEGKTPPYFHDMIASYATRVRINMA